MAYLPGIRAAECGDDSDAADRRVLCVHDRNGAVRIIEFPSAAEDTLFWMDGAEGIVAGAGQVLKMNGGKLEPLASGAPAYVDDVAALADGSLLLVSEGRMLEHDGKHWKPVAVPLGVSLPPYGVSLVGQPINIALRCQ